MLQESTARRLDELVKRREELTQALSLPDVFDDQDRYLKLLNEYNDLEEPVRIYKQYKEHIEEINSSREMLEMDGADSELESLLVEDIKRREEMLPELEQRLLRALLPRDPRDDASVVMEIRAGAGGEEAALFAQELFRMYELYVQEVGGQIDIVDVSETELGGLKEIIFTIDGKGWYSRLKFESGVHRVQRVPETESGGRIHTSTVTVAVMPEAEDVDLEIDQNDLRVDTYRASGAGGQHVNKTSSAIRITHLPSGMVVTSQDQRSQHQNRDKAMQVLRSRLLAAQEEAQAEQTAAQRRSQVGTGDRSERIRTYNYPQARVTDHRISLTLHRLDDVLAGDLDLVIGPLATALETQQLLEHGNDEQQTD